MLQNIAITVLIALMLLLIGAVVDLVYIDFLPNSPAVVAPSTQPTESAISNSKIPKPTTQEIQPPTSSMTDTNPLITVLPAKLIVAVSVEAWPFSYGTKGIGSKDFDDFKGFEVDLVKAMVCEWYYDKPQCDAHALKTKLEFVPTTVAERQNMIRYDGSDKFPARDHDPAHFLIGSVAYRDSRCANKQGDKSEGLICTRDSHANEDPYALLVKADSLFSSFCDPTLNNSGNRLILIRNTTGVIAIEDFKRICDIDTMQITESGAYDTRPEAIMAVRDGDGRDTYRTNYNLLFYAVDSSGQRVGDQKDKYRILPAPGSNSDNYRIWLRDENVGLRDKIESTLQGMKDTGKFDEICGGEPYCSTSDSN